jgi:hypothetical protein
MTRARAGGVHSVGGRGVEIDGSGMTIKIIHLLGQAPVGFWLHWTTARVRDRECKMVHPHSPHVPKVFPLRGSGSAGVALPQE